jgi:hypothetical protein
MSPWRLAAAWWRLRRARAQLARGDHAELVALLAPAPASATRAVDAPALARAIARAARLLPGTHCLPRALALAGWLRALGAPARLRIGVRRQDSGPRAHAWVELDGATPGEDPRQLAGFAILDHAPQGIGWTP